MSYTENYNEVSQFTISNKKTSQLKTSDIEKDNYLYIGYNIGCLLVYSLYDEAIIEDFKKVHQFCISSMVSTHDKKFLFTSDMGGSLKQWATLEKQLYYDYQKVHEGGIYSMACDDKYLFTSDKFGELKQWNI